MCVYIYIYTWGVWTVWCFRKSVLGLREFEFARGEVGKLSNERYECKLRVVHLLKVIEKKTGFIIVYDLYRYLYCMYFCARNLREFTFKFSY